LVKDIQNGKVGSVMVTDANGARYTTDYNGSGQVILTSTPSGSTLYAYSTSGKTPSYAGIGLAATGEGLCIALEPCGAGEATLATGTAIYEGVVLVAATAANAYLYFAKGGKQNIVPSWAEGERPLPGESAKDFAKRLCDQRYGAGNYDTGPTSEYSKIKKWAGDKFGI
jgi:YD repeat-containing protein